MPITKKPWRYAVQDAVSRPVVQWLLTIAFLVPVVGTYGQYAHSGFWSQSIRVPFLFWPGQEWSWGLSMPVWLSIGLMILSYVGGIGWMIQRRTFSTVVFIGLVALIMANIAGTALNSMTGWKELQMVSSMNLAGKANRAIFSLWHNPAWEEIVFRGIPLVALLAFRRKSIKAFGWPEWCYLIIPSIVFAFYHVPGHGPSRMLDTLILGIAFGWLALQYSFFAPLILHYVFDAMMVMRLGKMPNIPKTEISWLADNAVMLNSTWSLSLLSWFLTIVLFVVIRRLQPGKSSDAIAENS